MSALPVGVVTFLLTDIEASTRRWDHEPDAMRFAMDQHDDLFDRAVEQHSGVIVKPRGEGDSRFAVFPRASDAIAATVEFQRAFSQADWPTETPIQVRAAIHTGEADLRDGDYYGSTVNRCARLRSLAYGGQTLISLATAQLVRESLPEGVSLRDLGQHRLRDLSHPEHVFQLVIPGVPDEFPPLLSLDRHRTNLPIQATPFIGRKREIEQVRERLLDPETRLVTLTGPGGSGKTRLGLQVAASLVDEFPDGVLMVPLESVTDPDLLIPTIAEVIGVRESGGVSLADAVDEYFQDKSILLLLDNFERLVSGAVQLTTLLSGNPGLKLLVTSRVTLHIRGEREVSVPPLELPDPADPPPLRRLMEYEAVRLFVSRAQDIKPDFELTEGNAAAVLDICRLLDGLPLALELAAARIRLFPPHALLKRLDRRLPLLTGGARDLPLRQQTLRDTIAWSHELLNEQEQTLFRRLAVFAGGFTLEAATAVTIAVADGTADTPPASDIAGAAGDPWLASIEVFDTLDALVSKSLLRQVQSDGSHGDDPRFTMLETIREFGLEQLDLAGELGRVRRAHAEFFLMLAAEAEDELDGPDQGAWLQRLEQEHGNLRAAMTCALDAGDAGIGLKLTGTLWPFWEVRGYITEGRNWTERMLELGDGEPAWRARTLTGAGTMAWHQGEFERAIDHHSQALKLFEDLGDERGIAFALSNLGVQFAQQEDYEKANQLFVDSLNRYSELDDHSGIAEALNNLGILSTHHRDFERAGKLLRESLMLAEQIGDKNGIAYALHNLGDNAYFQQDYEQASRRYLDSLRLHREIGSKVGVILSLGALASVAAAQGESERGAILCGAVTALMGESDITLEQEERTRHQQTERVLIDMLGEPMYRTFWEKGGEFSLEEVVGYALSAVESQTSRLGSQE